MPFEDNKLFSSRPASIDQLATSRHHRGFIARQVMRHRRDFLWLRHSPIQLRRSHFPIRGFRVRIRCNSRLHKGRLHSPRTNRIEAHPSRRVIQGQCACQPHDRMLAHRIGQTIFHGKHARDRRHIHHATGSTLQHRRYESLTEIKRTAHIHRVQLIKILRIGRQKVPDMPHARVVNQYVN